MWAVKKALLVVVTGSLGLWLICGKFGQIYRTEESKCDKEPTVNLKKNLNITVLTKIYEPISGCKVPNFISTKPNPCWIIDNPKWNGQRVCAPSVILLGFHKCGTTDLTKWFYNETNFTPKMVDLFQENDLQERRCPSEVLEWHKGVGLLSYPSKYLMTTGGGMFPHVYLEKLRHLPSGDYPNYLIERLFRAWDAPTKNFYLGEIPSDNATFSKAKRPAKLSDIQTTSLAVWPGLERRFYLDCPGCLIISSRRFVSETLIVRSAVQYLTEFMTEDTKFLVTMRNPTDRAISHYFYLHQTKQLQKDPLFQNMASVEEYGNEFLHSLVVEELAILEKCIRQRGKDRCIISDGETISEYTGNPVISTIIKQSCYSIFIKEALQFIPRGRIYFSQMERYATETQLVMAEIMNFVDASPVPQPLFDRLLKKTVNRGKNSKPVLPKTVEVLDSFFQPFLEELADLLQDDRWLFDRRTLV